MSDEEENKIRDTIAGLDSTPRKKIYDEIVSATKDPDTYATLNWFFVAGLHHLYIGKYFRGLLALGAFLFGVGLIFSGEFAYGFGLIIAVNAFELIELFKSQSIVKNHNNKIAKNILKKHGVEV